MLPSSVHVLGITVVVATGTFTATFGEDWQVLAAYSLAVLLGAVIYEQADERLVRLPWGNLVIGVLLGIAGSLALGAALTQWYISLPLDLVLWQLGLTMFGSWVGISGAIFVTMVFRGTADALR